MKKSVLAIYALVLTTLASNLASAQADTARGTYWEERWGILNGNNIETVFFNFGEIGDWKDFPASSFIWPKGSNHAYIDGTAFIIQARVTTDSGRIIHPLETNYYEYTRFDPLTVITYGWAPLAGYARPGQRKPALSTDTSTWPTHWPDKPSDWDGQWNGFFGKGLGSPDLETYYVMDDNSDREYLPVFHPDSADTTRGGLGIRVRVRALQWNAPKAQDLLFVQYAFENIGTTRYDSTFIALFVDYGIGGHDNSPNNDAFVVPDSQMFVARSTVSYGLPGGWSPVGLLGVRLLKTPSNKGLTGARTFGLHTYDLDNDEENWWAINETSFNIQSTQGVNAACFLSSGPFVLEPGDKDELMLVYAFANDSASLMEKAAFAEQFYKSGFDTTVLTSVSNQAILSKEFGLDQNFPNPFNPTTAIRFHVSTKSRVRLAVFNLLGQQVAELANEEMGAGNFERFWNANVASGLYFCRLEAISTSDPSKRFVDVRKMVLLK